MVAEAMNAYSTAEGESSVTDDSTDLSKRDVRALTEKMTVLPETGRVKDADGLYLVVSGSGSEYLVDARAGTCDCPDARYNLDADEPCKHERRIAYATGERTIPEWVDVDAVDPLLGRQTESTSCAPPAAFQRTNTDAPRSDETVRSDGGVNAGEHGETTVREGESEDTPTYTYHYEPAHVGGARYVRCTVCGAECVPAKPARLTHRSGCSEGDR